MSSLWFCVLLYFISDVRWCQALRLALLQWVKIIGWLFPTLGLLLWALTKCDKILQIQTYLTIKVFLSEDEGNLLKEENIIKTFADIFVYSKIWSFTSFSLKLYNISPLPFIHKHSFTHLRNSVTHIHYKHTSTIS